MYSGTAVRLLQYSPRTRKYTAKYSIRMENDEKYKCKNRKQETSFDDITWSVFNYTRTTVQPLDLNAGFTRHNAIQMNIHSLSGCSETKLKKMVLTMKKKLKNSIASHSIRVDKISVTRFLQLGACTAEVHSSSIVPSQYLSTASVSTGRHSCLNAEVLLHSYTLVEKEGS